MDLTKKTVHYTQEGKTVFDRFYLDEDYNVPEQKEAVQRIVYSSQQNPRQHGKQILQGKRNHRNGNLDPRPRRNQHHKHGAQHHCPGLFPVQNHPSLVSLAILRLMGTRIPQPPPFVN